MNDQPDRCADCTTRPTCWINGICVKQRDSAKVEAPACEDMTQDSSYRAEKGHVAPSLSQSEPSEVERLNSKLAIQSKLTRDAEERWSKQCEYTNQIIEQREEYCQRWHAIKDESDRLRDELTAANDALIAAREQISDLTHRVTVSANHCAALIAEQREAEADHQRALRDYLTTRQFHQQQAADIGNPISSRGVSIPAAELDVTEQEDEAFQALEQRVTRAENAFLVLQGRVNTAHDRIDGLKDI